MVSPGPCTPAEAGISVDLIATLGPRIPTLGVCLGHQAVGAAFGGRIVRAPELMHGKTSPIHHDGDELFEGLPDPFTATRYHSLIIEEASLPDELARYGAHAGWAYHGRAASDPPDTRRAVSPGVDSHDGGTRSAPKLRQAGRHADTLMIVGAIQTVVEGRSLARDTAREVMESILTGGVTPAQFGALVTALRLKRRVGG